MSQVKNLIKRNHFKFTEWDRQLEEQQILEYAPHRIEAEADKERIFFQTNDLLISITNNFFTSGNFKDKWDTSKCSMYPFGQYLLLRSEKMDITFNWGVEYSDFYLEAYIMHGENMRFMTDEFWMMLLDLKDLGKFEYRGGGGLNMEERAYFENKTSTVFQMIRTFMLNQTAIMNNPHGQYNHSEYGTIILKWPMDNNWPLLLEKTCKAFRLLYKMNYQLWKVRDLSHKKGLNT